MRDVGDASVIRNRLTKGLRSKILIKFTTELSIATHK